jgi:hypothetical protein
VEGDAMGIKWVESKGVEIIAEDVNDAGVAISGTIYKVVRNGVTTDIKAGNLYSIDKHDFRWGECLPEGAGWFDDRYYPYRNLILCVTSQGFIGMDCPRLDKADYFVAAKLLAGIRFGESYHEKDGTHLIRVRHLHSLTDEDVFHMHDRWGR